MVEASNTIILERNMINLTCLQGLDREMRSVEEGDGKRFSSQMSPRAHDDDRLQNQHPREAEERYASRMDQVLE